MSVTITFLGGTGTVTGSKYLVQHEGQKLLVDCGLFQGYKQLRLRNWNPPTFEPKEINACVANHTADIANQTLTTQAPHVQSGTKTGGPDGAPSSTKTKDVGTPTQVPGAPTATR